MTRKIGKLPGKLILDYGKKLGLSPVVIARIYRLDISIEPKLFPTLDNLATRILDRIRPEIIAELLLLQETALLAGLPSVSESTRCQWCNMKARFVVDDLTLCPACTRIASNMKVAVKTTPIESFRL